MSRLTWLLIALAVLPLSSSRADDKADVEEFVKLYRLEPGQALKLVPAPRPKCARAWMEKEDPQSAERLDQITGMTFSWNEPDKLKQRTSHFGAADGWPLHSIPRYLEMGVHEYEIEGDRDLLKMPIPGDWVYREGASAEKKASDLEGILRKKVDQKIAVEYRLMERNVVVVRGKYRYTPIGNRTNNQIEIYGKEIVKNGGGSGGGGGTFPEFLKWVGSWIETPVVSEVVDPPANLSWSYNGRNGGTAKEQQEDHEEALVHKHLEEQTGLTYTPESRDIKVLVIEKRK
jgi:hypothetical protein